MPAMRRWEVELQDMRTLELIRVQVLAVSWKAAAAGARVRLDAPAEFSARRVREVPRS